MKNLAFIAIVMFLSHWIGACERPRRYVSTWTERIVNDHRFSHTLHVDHNRVRLQIQPPDIGLKKIAGMTVAFHYRINDGEIMTRFLTPKIPTFDLITDISPINSTDRLGYYFSFIFHKPEEDTHLSIESRWFFHKAPLQHPFQSQFSLHCQELFLESDERQLMKDFSFRPFPRSKAMRNKHFMCQAGV